MNRHDPVREVMMIRRRRGIPKELQQDVIEKLVEKAGLSRKSKGKFQVQLRGKDYEVTVKEYDSFGESAFTITLKERQK